MGYTFNRATRGNINLVIGLAGPSGSGKTFSAMRLASGLTGGKPFAVVDSENGRAKAYADNFQFDHCGIQAPFTPDAYTEAIRAADSAGYPVIVVDSMTHEWAGEGGLLDWQEAELERMAGTDYAKREACKMAAWVRPKIAHKQMVQRLLQVRGHLILCFRAEEKVKMERDPGGKARIVPQGWMPICEKNLFYEMTISFLLLPDRPGFFHPLKLQEQHKACVRLDAPLDENAGRALAQWAAGQDSKPIKFQPSLPLEHEPMDPFEDQPQPQAAETTDQHMTDEQWTSAIMKIDAEASWSEIKRQIKIQLRIDDLRKVVDSQERWKFLQLMLAEGQRRGENILV